ncbi:MAG: zeta toxin family protein [Deltaproteobacteria bacterium]|nr:zeta toxin family protein [Deltaproteobacteria bacterium]
MSAERNAERGAGQGAARVESPPPVQVVDAQGGRPFMRGIMVHSLMSRGASFEDAYRSATAIRDKLRGRGRVPREELARMAAELLGPEIEMRPLPRPRSAEVCEAGKAAPFSKGVLAQSLLAAAIAPDEAFDVARDIESRLLARRDARIERDALRGVVHSVIGSKLGERAATRYAVWRDFQHSEKPMILLLGGAAGVGKTSLAQEVAHRLGITRVTSTDAIRQVMRIMLSRELAPTLHASSYEAHREHPLAAEAGEDRVVEAFRAQTATISVGVRAMMQRAIEEREDLILEGVSILPGLISPGDFAAEAHVIFLAVGALSEQSLARRFERRGGSGRRSSRRYLQNLGAILCIQSHILELAEQFELPIVDNQSFDDSVLSILRHVTESLRKHGGNAA